ncbi:MAG: MarR family transcriptional regulator, partial [Lactococcus raffinolactis]|nr:MarR family transcriptional regulator [Lactococcus raffinolactis]
MTLVNKSKLLYQLKLANQELVSRFEKSTGFSITRYEMLLFINAQGPCSQTQLQQELGIDRAAVTRHLKRLQDLSYVTRKRNDLNNREIYVQITDLSQK